MSTSFPAAVPCLDVTLTHDFPPGTEVRLCGNLAALGAWDADASPHVLRPAAVSLGVAGEAPRAVLAASAPLPGLLAALGWTQGAAPGAAIAAIEYKLVARFPAPAAPPAAELDAAAAAATASGAAGAAAAGPARLGPWVWQPGPNRVVAPSLLAAPAAGTAAAKSQPPPPQPQVFVPAIREAWYTRRDGTTVVDGGSSLGAPGLEGDPWLEPNRAHLAARYAKFASALATLEAQPGGLDGFSRGYELFGFTRGVEPLRPAGAPPPAADGAAAAAPRRAGIWYREWAPGARAACLMGDFNGWKGCGEPGYEATAMSRDAFGVFSLFLPDRADGSEAIAHDSFVKLSLVLGDGSRATRVPAWIRYAVYDKQLNEYVGKYWNPPAAQRHEWRHARVRTAAAADAARPSPVSWGPLAGSPPLPIPSRSRWLGRTPPALGDADTAAAAAAGAPAAAATMAAAAAAAVAKVADAPAADATPAAGGPAVDPAADPAASGLRIYEAHVGMSGVGERVSSYAEFARDVLPRVARLGYNCLQLMAVMEHAYYGSFGYHVNQFLAPSSRFGTPEDLKALVDAAHGLGMLVIMDCVHSHANKNVNDGLNLFDGTDFQYFHSGARGRHELWDSRLFDYTQLETQRLLLSSLRLFAEEFRFDGFRFDGVTSMMYLHHGLSFGFSGDYAEYFGEQTDLDSVVFLMLANHLLHSLEQPCVSVAEDVSGMPTLCRPTWEGGVGFDLRLGMAVPDMWIKLLKEQGDEDWLLETVVWTLVNRRWQEKTITYCESHDQALVGDKTIAFWLMDKDMYWHMKAPAAVLLADAGAEAAAAAGGGAGAAAAAARAAAAAAAAREAPEHMPLSVDRGVALHKVIRLLTYALGGEGYLNFVGNEFGHPEWVDFPREGNGWSYKYCRRQWNLADDPTLLYGRLNAFDGAMHALERAFPWLVSRDLFVSTKHQGDHMLAFDRGTRSGPLVFVANLHPSASFESYRVAVPCAGTWEVALDSDARAFGGHGRVRADAAFESVPGEWNGRGQSVLVYSPCRTVLVLKLRK
jgi:1,4-alpha-glucan branching enzyme